MQKINTEEKLNVYSHAIGIIGACIGLIVLLQHNSFKTPYATATIIIYSLSLLSTFSISTWYHATLSTSLKEKLRIADHISIYFLIAGTYTPVCLIALIHGNGWPIFYTIWGFVLFGTLFKLFYTGKLEFLSLVIYALMGWLIVIDFNNLPDYISEKGLNLMIAGGLFYTIGIIFYAVRKIPYNHFIWHLFVLAGAICHWLMIYCSII